MLLQELYVPFSINSGFTEMEVAHAKGRNADELYVVCFCHIEKHYAKVVLLPVVWNYTAESFTFPLLKWIWHINNWYVVRGRGYYSLFITTTLTNEMNIMDTLLLTTITTCCIEITYTLSGCQAGHWAFILMTVRTSSPYRRKTAKETQKLNLNTNNKHFILDTIHYTQHS